MQIFSATCLLTFLFFTLYWLATAALRTTISIIKRSSIKHPTSTGVLEPYPIPSSPKITIKMANHDESKLTVGTNQSQKSYGTGQSINMQKVNDTNFENNTGLLGSNMQGQLSGGKSEEYSMASANSLINLGMIEEVRGGEGDRSGVELKQEKVEKVEKGQNQFEILGLIEGINQNEQDKQQKSKVKQAEDLGLIKSDDNQCCASSDHPQFQPSSNFVHDHNMRRQERSELQILQALSANKIQQFQQIQLINLPPIERQYSEGDPVITKLIQQIDQLFFSNQQQFQSIMNKYKIQEVRYTDQLHQQSENDVHQQHLHSGQEHIRKESESQSQKERIKQLEAEMEIKIRQMDYLQIALSEEKQAAENKDKQLSKLKNKADELQGELSNYKQKVTKYQEKLQKSEQQSRKNIELCDQLRKKTNNYQQEYLKLIQKSRKQKSPRRQLSPRVQQDTKEAKLLQQLSQSQHQKFRIQQQLLKTRQELNATREAVDKQKLAKGEEDINWRQKFQKLQDQKQKMEQQMKKERDEHNIVQDKIRSQLTEKEDVYMQKLKELQEQIDKIRSKAELKSRESIEQIKSSLKDEDNIKQNSQTPLRMITQNNKVTNLQLQEQVKQLQSTNENLKNQIEFAQTQIRMFEESEISYLKQIADLERRVQLTPSGQLLDLRSKIARMQPIVNEYQNLQKRYFQIKIKYEKLQLERSARDQQQRHEKTAPHLTIVNSGNNAQSGHNQNIVPNSPKSNRFSLNSQESPIALINSGVSSSSNNLGSKGVSDRRVAQTTIGHYKFLSDCSFLTPQDKEFLYQNIKSLLKGVLKTEKLYNSRTNRQKNPHQFIDNLRGILLLVQLQNSRLLGAYTHQPFTIQNPQSTPDNIAFIFDITNRCKFTNQSGVNSICYNASGLVWGFNQIMLKYEEPDVMYTNFCRNHNIFWDGKYKIEDFIGSQKQWARIIQYEVYRVSKI